MCRNSCLGFFCVTLCSRKGCVWGLGAQVISVLCTLPYFRPGYKAGGPVRTMEALVAALGNEVELRILTRDRDLGATVPYAGLTPDAWLPFGPAQVLYGSPRQLRPPSLIRLIRATPHDILYLNAFFSRPMAIMLLVARRLGLLPQRPVLVAPKGALSPAALAIKARRKRVYLRLGRWLGLFRGLFWQASTVAERDRIMQVLGVAPEHIRIAPDLVPLPAAAPPLYVPRLPGAPLRLLFLARIAPIKNLDFALRVLAFVRVPVEFMICGPVEDAAHAAACRDLARHLPGHVVASWLGGVVPARVPELLARTDLLFLPSQSESFGHAILEALAAGTPVLISDRTPWRGLQAAGIGADLTLENPAAFARVIEAQAALTPQDVLDQRALASAHAVRHLSEGADRATLRQIFADLAAGRG